MSALSEQGCQNELQKNIDLNINRAVENKVEMLSDECWARCLKHLPVRIVCRAETIKTRSYLKRLKEEENL